MADYAEWRARLAAANDAEFLPIEYIDQLLIDGKAQFWATEDGAVVTGIEPHPGGAIVCRSLAGAGAAERMIAELKPEIEAWAKSMGCTHCQIEGRAGWGRKHPDYSHFRTILIKEL